MSTGNKLFPPIVYFSKIEPTKLFQGLPMKAFACSGAVLCALVSPTHAVICTASHYGLGDGYRGRRTASGEIMNPRAMTAAHRTLAFGTRVTVTNIAAGRSVTVRINDRGPHTRGRCIDLSYGAARALGMGGSMRVKLEK